ncbi:unnamed protein product [Penicillium salamii]|nr:unnamed protein product [Penicillium salamii]CAG8152507.1 unnamed protein product [Penicillium salamii]CAG8402664.1 unnamed protein product [Penicillium salamii]
MNGMTISKFHSLLAQDPSLAPTLITNALTSINNHDQILKSIITTNPAAISEAKTQKQTQNLPLHNIPIILKDNYTTPTLPTTAGVLALRISHSQSTVYTRLKEAGAIILAKANLHEFALQGITLSSVRGQTLNPYDPSRTPGGSSGGTAAAIAAGFAIAGCGTDTVNSLRSPASACGIVGFRPSTGRIPTDGVVPVSFTQDVLGPMAGCVADVRLVYAVMAGLSVSPVCVSRKWRVGVLESFFGPEGLDHGSIAENRIVRDVVGKALDSLHDVVELVPISRPKWSFEILSAKGDTQAFEFKYCLDKFLGEVESSHSSLESIVRSGEYSREAVTEVFEAGLVDPDTYCVTSEAYQERLEFIAGLKGDVDCCFQEFGVDALVYPHQRQLPVKIGVRKQGGRNGILAALTGRPAICIPAGMSPRTETAVKGVPTGLEFMGKRWGEDDLLDLAECVEGILQVHETPDMRFFESR